MKMNKNNQIKLRNYIEIFLLMLLTLGPYNPNVKIVIYIFLTLFNFKYLNLFRSLTKFRLLLLASMIIPMILDIANIDANTGYSLAGFAYLIPFIFSMFYVRKYSFAEYIKMYEKVAFFVSVCSLIGMALILFAPSIINRFPTIVFYGRNLKSVVVFGALRDYTQVNFLKRNCGIAFEPGAFQLIPNLGLAALFMNMRGKHFKLTVLTVVKIIVYVGAVLSTYSTTGIIILALLLILNFLKSRKHFLIIGIIILGFGSMFITSYQHQVSKMETGNLDSRFGNSMYVIENYSSHIFGIGSTGYDKIYKTDSRIGSWDTYTNLYLRFGLLFSILFIIMNLKLIKNNKDFFIVVVLTLLTESVVGPIIVMLYYYAEEWHRGRDTI